VAQVAAAQRKMRLIDTWQALVDGGRTGDDAITVLRRRGHDVSRASIARWSREYSVGGFDALIDRRRGHSGRPRRVMLVAANEVAAIRSAHLVTNRTADSGSDLRLMEEAYAAQQEEGLPIIVKGERYGSYDPSFQIWKVYGKPKIVIYDAQNDVVLGAVIPILADRDRMNQFKK
jgi:hypothetical protein